MTIFDDLPMAAAAAVALRGLRREIMGQLDYSLRELYRTLEEPGANPLAKPIPASIPPSALRMGCPLRPIPSPSSWP